MATKRSDTGTDAVRRLQALIKDIRIAMLITHVGEPRLHGGLHGRPMETQDAPFDGKLWFLTSAASPKALEIEEDAEVALVYADSQSQRYVYVTGRARVLRDARKLDELWRPEQTVWFPAGRQDPDLRLLEVTVTRALYWIRGSQERTAAAMSEALETGAQPDLGDSGTIEFEERAVPGAEGAAAQHTRPVVAGADDSAHNTGRVSRGRGSSRTHTRH